MLRQIAEKQTIINDYIRTKKSRMNSSERTCETSIKLKAPVETVTFTRTPLDAFGSASAMSLFDGCCPDEPFVYSFASSGKVSRLSASPRSYSFHLSIAEDPSTVSSFDVTRESAVVEIENT